MSQSAMLAKEKLDWVNGRSWISCKVSKTELKFRSLIRCIYICVAALQSQSLSSKITFKFD